MSKNNRTVRTPDAYAQQPEGRVQLYNQTYLGFVRKIEDDIHMGRLKVWIPDLGGDSDREESWYTVNYCSPFAGATNIKQYDNSRDSEWKKGNVKDSHKYTESQVSYGFWAMPVDIDNEVVINFINGDPTKGIWVGCMWKQYMNHMVPGIPTAESWDEAACGGEHPPVGEYNKFAEIGNNLDPTRPRYDPLHNGIKMQGTYTDPQRGPSTSGARRESPSKVFGMLTPDGSQMYADDNGDNQFIRFRTKTGVQVLIHETDGYVYMNSKKGNSWMQIGDDGIDLYTTKQFNVRAMDGINMHSDKDFNLHVAGNMNTFVGGDVRWGTVGNWDQETGKDHKLDIGGAYHSTIEKNRTVLIKGTDSLDVNGNLTVHSDKVFTMTADGLMLMKGAPIKQNCSDKPNEPDVPAAAAIKDPCILPDRLLEECYPATKTPSVVTRLPTHEPFDGHTALSKGEPYFVADCSGSAEDTSTPDPTTTGSNPDTPPTDNTQDPTQDPNNPPPPPTPPNNPNNPNPSDPADNVDDPTDPTNSPSNSNNSNNSPSNNSNNSNNSSSGGSSSSGSSSSSSSPSTSNSSSNANQNTPIQDAVAKANATDATQGYNSTQDNNAYTPTPQTLTNKTNDQINQIQDQMKSSPANTQGKTGAGRYNMNQSQVQQAQAGLAKSGADKFSSTSQDQMADYLMEQAGLSKWRAGALSDDQIVEALAQVFPALPTTTGKTIAGSAPGITLPALRDVLEQVKTPSAPSELDQVEPTTDITKTASISLGIVRNGVNVGTGTVIDYSGTVVTNAQVIGIITAKIDQQVTVEIGGRVRIAVLVALNGAKDIAHLRLKDFADLTPIDRAGITSDAALEAYGYAFGQTLTGVKGTGTGQTNKTVTYVGPGNPPKGLIVYGLSTMTTADVNGMKPGMAGGPVLDSSGKMLGIISASAAGSTTNYYIPF